MAVGRVLPALLFSVCFVFFCMSPAMAYAPIDCYNSTVHYCDTGLVVAAINGVVFNGSVLSGGTMLLVVNWTGWHYTDDNHWAFFLDDSSSPLGTCVSFVDDLNVNNSYLMSCSMEMPYDVEAGLHNLTVTVNDAPGYCNPSEEGVDAEYTTSVNVSDPPVILRSIQCEENGSVWGDCSGISYGDVLSRVRVNCTSLNSTVVSALFSLENMPDLNYLYLNASNSSIESGMLVYDSPDLLIEDSGFWNLTAYCSDTEGESTAGSVAWEVPWGRLEAYLINPENSVDAVRHGFFNYTSGVRCLGGECGGVNATLDPEGLDDRENKTECTQESSHPIMKADLKTLGMWVKQYQSAREISAGGKFKSNIFVSNGSLSLLEHLNYIPAERNQGRCGNCWLWAGTGVMEVALDVQNDIFDRLSTQYINSYETVLMPYKTCCGGGMMRDYVMFYNLTRRAVPWSNENAYYQDGDGSCDTDYNEISTTPNYHITHIEELAIPTATVDNQTAVANIKNVLHQDKAVWFAFFLPDDDSWQDFFDFWSQQNESAVYHMDKFCGIPYDGGGGHAVLCVGYNDTDSENPHWVMLNSWGAGEGRPSGLFRISMDMDYNCATPYQSFLWETLNVTFDFVDNKGVIPVNAGSPFYTTSSNPQVCPHLKSGESCNQTWVVNATGYPGTSWHFYAIYESNNYSTGVGKALTPLINVTITAYYSSNCDAGRCTYRTPCSSGFGDCDSDNDCMNGTCVYNAGMQYGCPRWVDMCLYSNTVSLSSSSSSSARSSATSRMKSSSSSSSSTSRMASTSSSFIRVSSSSSSSSSTSRTPTTTLPNCGVSRCTAENPCALGFGDCDCDSDCINGSCRFDVGLNYGCPRWVDVCA